MSQVKAFWFSICSKNVVQYGQERILKQLETSWHSNLQVNSSSHNLCQEWRCTSGDEVKSLYSEMKIDQIYRYNRPKKGQGISHPLNKASYRPPTMECCKTERGVLILPGKVAIYTACLSLYVYIQREGVCIVSVILEKRGWRSCCLKAISSAPRATRPVQEEIYINKYTFE